MRLRGSNAGIAAVWWWAGASAALRSGAAGEKPCPGTKPHFRRRARHAAALPAAARAAAAVRALFRALARVEIWTTARKGPLMARLQPVRDLKV